MLGEGLGEAVGQGFQQDRVVVVVGGLEFGQFFFDTQPGCYREQTCPVLRATFCRRDVVGQAAVGPALRLGALLAEEVQGFEFFVAAFIGEQHHVITARSRRV